MVVNHVVELFLVWLGWLMSWLAWGTVVESARGGWWKFEIEEDFD